VSASAHDEQIGILALVEQHLRAAALDRLAAHRDPRRGGRRLLAAVSQMRPAIVCDASTEASTPTSLGVYQGEG